jgi:anti-sigma regulatory factor (Ser/Thr protein kinase)
MNTTASFAVHEASQVAEPRRAALLLAQRLGYGEVRAGQVGIVVSELATNLAKHAKGGEILLRSLGDERMPCEPVGIEVLAIDSGPGMRDEALSRRDGYSTTGTLGHGLGAIERQAHLFDIYTQPTGTVAVARIWRDEMPDAVRQPRYEVGAVRVSKIGEDISGDDWTWSARDDRLALVVADGLGHGLAAYDASHAAVGIFRRHTEESPQEIVTRIHAGLRASRGAAVAAAAIDIERGVLRYCGLGNIGSVILLATGGRQSLVSQNGTAGHTATRIQEFNYPMPRESVLVMHSDGLGTRWDLSGHPGLRTCHPSVIAGVLYRDASRRRDDVTVVVVKERRR